MPSPAGLSTIAAAALAALPHASRPPVLVRAPGRVNLLGEHTDYNGLPVLPMAIERSIVVAAVATPERRVRVRSLDPGLAPAAFALRAPIRRSPAGAWVNYVKAAVEGIGGARLPAGADLVVGGDLPAGVGLSSSSALVVATALALLALERRRYDRLALATRLAAAERYVGTLSGGMDQATILLGRPGRVLRIDFHPLRARPCALPPRTAVVVCDSLVRAEKAGRTQAAYNRRVVECRLATCLLSAALGRPLRRLGDLGRRSWDEALAALAARVPNVPCSLAALARAAGLPVARLRPLLRDDRGRALALGHAAGFRPLARARHVLTEAARVEEAGAALATRDAAALGALMNASHQSCRDDFEISVPAVEALVTTARAAGALGARVTGAGFGGCTVNLVSAAVLPAFLAHLDREFYAPRLARGARPSDHRWVCAPSAGATVTRSARAPG